MTNQPHARKELGQHFLSDNNIIGKIIAAINPQPHETILEIGPGPGAMTRELLKSGAHIVVVEKDERFPPLLQEIAHEVDGSLEIVQADALKVDFTKIIPENCKVVGNLPYNVGTQITINLLETHTYFQSLIFMLQEEVIDRMMATPNQKDWGRLAVLCDLLCERRKLFNVPPTAFKPPPKVMSSIIKLTPLEQPRFDVDRKKLDHILRSTFGQRRKMLRASLKGQISEEQMITKGITPTARPETLSLKEFCDLTTLL